METKHFKWIVFEGCEGSGKTTLARKLTKYIISENKQKFVQLTSEPCLDVDTEIEKGIPEEAVRFLNTGYRKRFREMIKFSDDLTAIKRLSLFLEDRTELYFLFKSFSKDTIVIQDRCYISTLAYQQVYLGFSPKDLIKINFRLFNDTYNIRPDLILYLHASPEIAISRLKNRDNDYMDREAKKYIKAIYKNYYKFFIKNKIFSLDPFLKNNTIIEVIDTDKKTKDEVFDLVKSKVVANIECN